MRRVLIALSLLVCLSGCIPKFAPLQANTSYESRFQRAEQFLLDKKYADALAELDLVRSESSGSPEAARAHFYTALIYAMPDNPELNYGHAILEFSDFLKLYPGDTRSRDAEVWISALTQNVELKKENATLHKNIDRLMRLDIRQEERRRK